MDYPFHQLEPTYRLSELSERERAVLAHLMNGLSAEDIAKANFVGLCTVRTQIRMILQKLGVHSQLAAVAVGYRALLPAGVQVVIPR